MTTPGRPDEYEPVWRWIRNYRVPLILTGVFLGLVAVFALTSSRQPFSSDVTAQTEAPSTPAQQRCLACGIGETCDNDTGECTLVKSTAAPCLPGSHYDDDAKFCVPNPTAKPTPLPAKTLDPGTIRTPQAPRTPDIEPEPEITPEPVPTPEPEPTPGFRG